VFYFALGLKPVLNIMPGLPAASFEKFISPATHKILDRRWNADVAVLRAQN
jgi:hypothetical protein